MQLYKAAVPLLFHSNLLQLSEELAVFGSSNRYLELGRGGRCGRIGAGVEIVGGGGQGRKEKQRRRTV